MTNDMDSAAPLVRGFYARPPDVVARDLLGKVLLRRWQRHFLAGRIVEVEAYFGQDDPAAHSFAGPTARNQVLFGPPGHAYVYFIYGVHYCLNVSCEPEGHAGCVLIRALEPVAGLDQMARLRGLSPGISPRLLTSGPGRLCQALAITRENSNTADLTDPTSPIKILEDRHAPANIAITPRIGIRKASERPLRFSIDRNPFVSASQRKLPSP